MRTLTLLVVFALASCGSQSDGDSTGNNSEIDAVSKYDLGELQAQADEACLCEMRTGQADDCWSGFKLATKKLPSSGFGSASFPLSHEVICFGNNGEDCVSIGSRLVGGIAEGLVCTRDQIADVEALHSQMLEKNENSLKAADIAAGERIAQLSNELSESGN